MIVGNGRTDAECSRRVHSPMHRLQRSDRVCVCFAKAVDTIVLIFLVESKSVRIGGISGPESYSRHGLLLDRLIF